MLSRVLHNFTTSQVDTPFFDKTRHEKLTLPLQNPYHFKLTIQFVLFLLGYQNCKCNELRPLAKANCGGLRTPLASLWLQERRGLRTQWSMASFGRASTFCNSIWSPYVSDSLWPPWLILTNLCMMHTQQCIMRPLILCYNALIVLVGGIFCRALYYAFRITWLIMHTKWIRSICLRFYYINSGSPNNNAYKMYQLHLFRCFIS